MNRLFCFALMLIVVASHRCFGDDVAIESTYFPIRPGSNATFRFPGIEHEYRCTRVEVFDKKVCGRFETFVNGKMSKVEHIHVAADGVYRVAFNGNKIDPPLLLLQLPPRVGQDWLTESKLMGQKIRGDSKVTAERVVSPAGVFATMVVKSRISILDAENKPTAVMQSGSWFAPKVGMVKQSLTIGDKTAEGALIAYRPGQPPPKKAKADADEPQLAKGDYFPIKLNSISMFRSPGVELETRCARMEKFADIDCARMENYVNGKLHSFEHVETKPEGVYRVGYNGDKLEPPILLLKLPVRAGDVWSVRTKIKGDLIEGVYKTFVESIATANGNFVAVLVKSDNLTTTSADGKTKATVAAAYWYAPNVGLVKHSMTHAGSITEGELFKFQPGH